MSLKLNHFWIYIRLSTRDGPLQLFLLLTSRRLLRVISIGTILSFAPYLT
jgi:hypothetical protein